MKVKFKKLMSDAVLPQKAHDDDAGLDLTALWYETDEYGSLVYHFGLAVEIPKGYVGLIFPRSSIAKKSLYLTNSVGVIDSGYRGEITAKFKPALDVAEIGLNFARSRFFGDIYHKERICQLIIMPYPAVEAEWADELSETDRGEGGYGSTGK